MSLWHSARYVADEERGSTAGETLYDERSTRSGSR